MKTIFIILLTILAGFVFGFLLVKLFIFISDKILEYKARKEILRKNLKPEELKQRNFYFKDKFFNLAEAVENDLKKHYPWYKRIFSKEKKGVENGRTTELTGLIEKPISTDNGSSTTTDTIGDTEQPNTNTPK